MQEDKYEYKITDKQKHEIAQNLIEILEINAAITNDTTMFIGDWILTGPEEKSKDFFDVWEIVLNHYSPKSTPVLYRSCKTLSKNGKIASFTSRLECASRFSGNKGYLIICETKEVQAYFPLSYFPLVDILTKANAGGGWGFSETLLNQYIGEEEYIMRINLDLMHSFKWINTNK